MDQHLIRDALTEGRLGTLGKIGFSSSSAAHLDNTKPDSSGFQGSPFGLPNLSTIRDIGGPQGSSNIGSNWAE